MHKLLTGLAAASALALLASAAQADCPGHNDTTASVEKSEQGVAMSTYDGATAPVVVSEDEKAAEVTATASCAEGDEDCAPAAK